MELTYRLAETVRTKHERFEHGEYGVVYESVAKESERGCFGECFKTERVTHLSTASLREEVIVDHRDNISIGERGICGIMREPLVHIVKDTFGTAAPIITVIKSQELPAEVEESFEKLPDYISSILRAAKEIRTAQ